MALERGVGCLLKHLFQPPSGSNSHALRITFDHINRREEVNTMPRSSGEKGKRSTSQGVRHNGLPSHFIDPKTRLRCLRIESSHHHVTSTHDQKNQGVTTGSAPNLSNAELNDLFESKLRSLLTNPKILSEFRLSCSNFVGGKLLATEFYEQLSSHFFTVSHQLDSIFPLLVATIPVDGKREALRQVRQMLNAPEIQRLQRAKQEDEMKNQQASKQPLRAGAKATLKKTQTAWSTSKPVATAAPLPSAASNLPGAC
eukprot:CAMPEP_0176471364 /NCGR_PEP_ID=MMETSP0127-20121128/41089_1 /TAXON_ID=938130 /ORGANISM="Platyophrya macrostoma, Strain WH" /LENGTH=255 /DNA_ID=CAMNT_0017865999 /DNA_START=680 /DNA_END=1448 /DNA_ORIENTATION=+